MKASNSKSDKEKKNEDISNEIIKTISILQSHICESILTLSEEKYRILKTLSTTSKEPDLDLKSQALISADIDLDDFIKAQALISADIEEKTLLEDISPLPANIRKMVIQDRFNFKIFQDIMLWLNNNQQDLHEYCSAEELKNLLNNLRIFNLNLIFSPHLENISNTSKNIAWDIFDFLKIAYSRRCLNLNLSLKIAANSLDCEFAAIKENIKPKDLPIIQNLVDKAKACAEDPTPENLMEYNISFKKAKKIRIGDTPWEKTKLGARAAGFGIAVLGFLLIAASIASIPLTVGASTPASFAGIYIGFALIGATTGAVMMEEGIELANTMDKKLTTERNMEAISFFKTAENFATTAKEAIPIHPPKKSKAKN